MGRDYDGICIFYQALTSVPYLEVVIGPVLGFRVGDSGIGVKDVVGFVIRKD